MPDFYLLVFTLFIWPSLLNNRAIFLSRESSPSSDVSTRGGWCSEVSIGPFHHTSSPCVWNLISGHFHPAFGSRFPVVVSVGSRVVDHSLLLETWYVLGRLPFEMGPDRSFGAPYNCLYGCWSCRYLLRLSLPLHSYRSHSNLHITGSSQSGEFDHCQRWSIVNLAHKTPELEVPTIDGEDS